MRHWRKGWLLLLLVWSLGVAQAQEADPADPAAFNRDRDCGAAADLTPTPAARVALMTGGVWLRDLDSGENFRLETAGAVVALDWSPDGSRLALTLAADPLNNGYDLALTDGTGSTVTTPVVGTLLPGVLAWSPGGGCLLYGQQTAAGAALVLSSAEGSDSPTVTVATVSPGRSFTGLAWSPDGTRLARVEQDAATGAGTLIISGAGETRLYQDTSDGTATQYRAPVWSPDGTRLAFLAAPRQQDSYRSFNAYVLNLAEDTLVRLSRSGRVTGYAWSPGSRQLALVDAGRLVFINSDGSERRETGVAAHAGIAWLRDGAQLIFAGASQVRRQPGWYLYSLAEGLRYPLVDIPVPPPALTGTYAVALTPAVGGLTLATRTPEPLPAAVLRLPFGLAALTPDNAAGLQPLAVVAGRLSPDFTTRVAFDAAGTLQLLNSRTGEVLLEREQVPPQTGIQYSPDGRTVALVGPGSAGPPFFVLWDVRSRRVLINARRNFVPYHTPAVFSADGGRLVVPAMSIWDTGTRRVVNERSTRQAYAALSADGQQVALLAGAEIFLMPVDDLRRMDTEALLNPPDAAPAHLYGQQPYTALAYSPDGVTLAAGRMDGSVDVWSVVAGTLRAVLTVPGVRGYVSGLAFNSDGRLLAVATAGYTGAQPDATSVWDMTNFTTQITLADGDQVQFSHDDRVLLVSDGVATRLYSRAPDPEAPPRCTLVALRNGNIRESASTGVAVVGRVRAGDVLEADSVRRRDNGRLWYHLVSEGWIRADLVEAAPECADLPEKDP
ncbi:MAG: hypothetical protein MUE40_09860 [Anaerolineae bacterium]|jgi:WD40 repeat protein|nr:hypothetical protein [Anaerolineae bacterium]